MPVVDSQSSSPARAQVVVPLRHSLYLNVRAAVLGGAIGYAFWFVAHNPRYFWPVVGGTAALTIFATLWTSQASFAKPYRLNYLILPLVLLASSLFFFLLLKNPSYQLIFVAVIGAIYWYFFRSFAELREHPSPEKKKGFTQALDVVTSVTMFLALASLQELYFFFSWKVWAFVLTGALLSAAFLYQSFWYHRLITLRAWVFIMVGALAFIEILWAVAVLPTGYLTNTLLSVAALFVIQSLAVASLRGLLKSRTVLENLGIAALIVIIALFSSRWTPLA